MKEIFKNIWKGGLQKVMDKTVGKNKKSPNYWMISFVIMIILSIVLLVSYYPSPVRVNADNEIIGIGNGFAGSQLVADIKYPSDVDTDYEKLEAVYSLIEQMRLEHNRVGEIARSNWEEYQDEWYEYARIFRAKLQPLLEESIKLRSQIKEDTYTEEEWKKLDIEVQLDTLDVILPDKNTVKAIPTSASTELLTQLKAIDFYSLDGTFVDPTEDFTSSNWNNGTPQSDPNSRLTIDSNSIECDDMSCDEEVYFYRTHTVSGDFEWLFTLTFEGVGSGYRYGSALSPGLTDTADDITGAANSIGFWFYHRQTSYLRKYVVHYQNGSATDSDYYEEYPTIPYTRYITMDRTGTTLTAKIYSDSNRTTLLDTVSCTVPSSDFPYIMGIQNTDSNYSDRTISFTLDDFDLQEGGTPSIANSPSSENLGVVDENSTYYAYGSAPSNPVQDGECTFTITNNGSISTDIYISATNFTGGNGWTLTSGSPGSDQARITAYYSGQNPANGVILTTSVQSFYTGLAPSATLMWDFSLEIGTFTDSEQKSSTITLTAVAP